VLQLWQLLVLHGQSQVLQLWQLLVALLGQSLLHQLGFVLRMLVLCLLH